MCLIDRTCPIQVTAYRQEKSNGLKFSLYVAYSSYKSYSYTKGKFYANKLNYWGYP